MYGISCNLLSVLHTCFFKYISCYTLNERKRNLGIVIECSISLFTWLMLVISLILILKFQFVCCLFQDGLTPLDLCLYSGQSFQTYVLIKLLKQPQGYLWHVWQMACLHPFLSLVKPICLFTLIKKDFSPGVSIITFYHWFLRCWNWMGKSVARD